METNLILASRSAARQKMLTNAGFQFDVILPQINERDVNVTGLALEDTAVKLSIEKALNISLDNPQKYIIGSDQLLIFNNEIWHKPSNIDEAKENLQLMSGKSHDLLSAAVVLKNGKTLYKTTSYAKLTMLPLTKNDIDNYCAKAGDVLTSCAGSYEIEGHGARLFEKITGDFFTIQGMPLIPLSKFLYDEGFAL